MGRDADIVVVGGGITGVATARALAQAGSGVLLLEQFALGHSRGSSHGSSRIFRLTYPDDHYVRLAQAALEGWRELEAECGQTLIVRNGSPRLRPLVNDDMRALGSCGVRYELLDGAEVAARWGLAAEPDERALFQPDGGVTLADRAHSAFVEAARAAGATVAEEAPVTGLTLDRAAVRVSTHRDEIVARAVVVTAGAWAPELLGPLGIELPVVPTRETVAYFDVPRRSGPASRLIDTRHPHGRRRPGSRAPGRSPTRSPHRASGSRSGLHHSGPVTDPGRREPPTPGSSSGSATGWPGATRRADDVCDSTRRRASTRTRPTRASSSSGTAGSSSAPPARATASSSRRARADARRAGARRQRRLVASPLLRRRTTYAATSAISSSSSWSPNVGHRARPFVTRSTTSSSVSARVAVE